MRSLIGAVFCLLCIAVSAQAPPSFEVDPDWPEPLPERWLHGQLSGVCVDAHDHVVVLDRRDITADQAQRGSIPASHVLMFGQNGDLIAHWGDPERLPLERLHGCSFDAGNNLWITGNRDGIIQKYSHSGELLMQIGTRGVVDSPDGTAEMGEDGTLNTEPLNASRDGFFYPAQVAVDSETGEIYVADGYGNKRVAVFDADGRFLRQWGRQATLEEVRNGAGGVFAYAVHCIMIGNNGLVYVCDREGDRVQVFDKLGHFARNIWIAPETTPELPARCERPALVLCFDNSGTAWGLAFSPDPDQHYLYVMDGRNERVHIIERASGRTVSGFGRPGHQIGHFDYGHSLAVDSRGRIYVAESGDGRRVQRFVPVDD